MDKWALKKRWWQIKLKVFLPHKYIVGCFHDNNSLLASS